MIGVVAGAVALGVAQLVAGLTNASASPVIAVGGALVDQTPAALKEWAIRTFGSNDKVVLITGIVVVLALIAAGLGVLSRRRIGYGMTGLLVFGLVGAGAAATRPDSGPFDILPSLIGVGAGSWALSLLFRRVERNDWDDLPEEYPVADATPAVTTGAEPEARPAGEGDSGRSEPIARPAEMPPVMRAGDDLYTFDRRRLLTGVVVGVGVAGVAGFGGNLLASSRDVDVARRTVAKTLPRPTVPAKPIPAGADLRIRGLSPFVTPNRDFYRVDTALVVPSVDPADWTLKIHGLVDKPVELTFDDLLKRPLMEADVTLTCVSNDVGGPYVGNARWLGARLADVLRDVGIRPEADMLLSVSQDGFTCGTPVDVVMDGRDALLAVAMNGEVLPAAHGFPVRQVVPGLYGYVSATKWITEIKATRFDQDEAYWTPRGWAPMGPIKTESRIDVPRGGDSIPSGPTTIAGVAWAQHKGISAVEVQIDGGEWREAKLAEVNGPDTWRQWSIEVHLPPGRRVIAVRATDASGYTQTPNYAPPAPDGASGHHAIEIQVD
ncbi:molybdopterin-dependent oxidoreductase [Planotetraspora phitsanulokensis]|uniref:Molybdopterin-binding protein n=1 Tax=Planotetraspora phitsanulokensis TaxID=575192 RepID=A0A8J3U7V3_9ACTN|nr:molybdopterin-binding protein [Planotetraspora phitsanulokensis]